MNISQQEATNLLTALARDRNIDVYSVKKRTIIEAGVSIGWSETWLFDIIKLYCPRVKHGYYDMSRFLEKSDMSLSDFQNAPVTDEGALEDGGDAETVVEDLWKEIYKGDTLSDNDSSFIPKLDKGYVPWGHTETLLKIVDCRQFLPVYISGDSGNGKSMMVEQVCAKLKRKFIRIQITPETDQDDLLGGLRLSNGSTTFEKGPVVRAMEEGAVLLLDEIDRSTNRIMALQGVMEGNPVLLKKTGELITPKDGFTVIATANTRGKGSQDGRFSAAGIIDEAFLERFVISINQEYPPTKIEREIISKSSKLPVKELNSLIKWATRIRKTFEDGGVDETISTRRLVHIAKVKEITGDIKLAVELCTNRFEEDTRVAFVDIWDKLGG